MERYAEVIFEDFQFSSMGLVTSHSMLRQAAFDLHKIESPCQIVIDSGFSFTYAVPFFNGIPIKHASLRIDVGGKLLTNLLTETISHKDFNLQGEFGIVNSIKENACYLVENNE